MEFSGSGRKRTVRIDGQSYLSPSCTSLWSKNKAWAGKRYLQLDIPLLAGSCTVNGKTVSKRLDIAYRKPDVTMETLLVLRALRETVMPRSGPSQNKVHKIPAAYVMQAFDLEHPDSGVLDTDIVLVQYKRRAYVMESCFLAGDLRQCDRGKEFGLLATALSMDTSVTSGVLEPAPEACDVESAAAARDLLHPGVVKAKRVHVVSAGPRTVTCDDGTSWRLPEIISCRERKFAQGSCRRLILHIRLTRGSCEVNGRTIDRTVQLDFQIPDISKRNILAMRAIRDDIFPVNEPARHQIHKSVAAIILRVFDRENPGSDVLDDTVVAVRINRYGYVKESSFVAGDLRTENRDAFSILAKRFLNDPVVMGGELEPAPAISLACKGSTPADSETETEATPTTTSSRDPAELSNATVVGTKRGGSKGEGRRDEESTKVPSLPRCIYKDSEGASGGPTLRLKVKLGAMCVNGEEVEPAKKMKVVGGIPMNAGNIAALSALRDEFALGLGASTNVRNIIAAKAFRLWLRRRRTSEILDSTPVSITDAAAKPTADGLLPSITMTAGRLRGVDAERSSVLRALLTTLGATGAEPQSNSQDQPVIVVDDDGPAPSGSGKRSKTSKKRKREEDVSHSDAETQPVQKHRVGSDGHSGGSSGGGTGGERCSSAKRAKRRISRKDQETRPEGQPAQEGGTMNGAKNKRMSVGKNSRRANSGVDEAAVFSAGRRPKKKRNIKQQGAASCSGEQSSPSTTNKPARRHRDDNPGGTSPKRASKKRSKATENTSLSPPPVQPDGSTEAEKRTKKKKRKKTTNAVERGSESSLGEQEGSMQESAAGTKDVPVVVDLTSNCPAAQVKKVKKKKKREENLRCSYESDGLTEGGTEKKRRKVAKETHQSNSSSEVHEGSARPKRQPAKSIPDSKRKGSKKKKRKRREREERQKSSDHQGWDGSGEVAGEGYSSSLVGDEASQRDTSVRKIVRPIIDLTSGSSKQDKKKKKKKREAEEGEEKETTKNKKNKNKTKKADEP